MRILSSVKEGAKETDPSRSFRKRTRRAKVGQKLGVCSRNRDEGMRVDCLTKCKQIIYEAGLKPRMGGRCTLHGQWDPKSPH